MLNNILEVKNLTKMYNPSCGIKDISFSLKSGEIVGFLGKNGAGKTTTIKLIMNLLQKDQGEIKIFGKDHYTYEKEIKKKTGFVYDQLYYYSKETAVSVKKNMRRFYQNWDDDIFENYMKKFTLPYNRKINELSQGMKMKLGIAIALSHNAELLIMDEPTSGLDPVVRNDLLEVLKRTIKKNRKKSLLFSSHITEDVQKIADRIIIIAEGKIAENCNKRKLLNEYYFVEGEKSLLKDEINNVFINIKENKGKFKGLTNKLDKVFDYLEKDKIEIKKADFDDILINIIEGV